jgi:hypothetical protein
MARLNMARSRVRPAICNLVRIDRTPIGPSQTDPRSHSSAGSAAWKGPGIGSARLFVGKQELIPWRHARLDVLGRGAGQ